MRNTLFVITISILTLSGGKAQKNIEFTDEESVLDFYCQQSFYTNPGKYEFLYSNLPDSLPELCRLIQSQLIHPFAELPQYKHIIPENRWNEFRQYPTVESVLEGLYGYDSLGFVKDRKTEERLVLICRHSAIMLVSVLRHRGIPARIRCGHASYLIPNFNTAHVVTEVWNENEKRWMLVDPGMGMIDFDPEKFDFGNEAYMKLQSGEIDPSNYGIPRMEVGKKSILGKLPLDLAYLLGNEYTILDYAPIFDTSSGEYDLTQDQLDLLNRICMLMESTNAKNLSALQEIYNSTPDIQISKKASFNLVHETKNVSER